MPQTPLVVLTIAGFDPSAGAGITADIKTIAAHGCYGLAAITALTVQSTAGVSRVAPVEGQLFSDTLDELAADIKLSAVHIGMLGTGDIAARVADFLDREKPPNIVLDPVLKASSGTKLLDDGGVNVLTERLLQLATVVTPNVSEAASLTGTTVANLEDMKLAAQVLQTMGAEAVVITGGELDHAIDVLSLKNDYSQVFRSDRVESNNTHGTGCAFSTSVACQLALGRPLSTAVLLAKAYVTGAITNAYPIGKGIGPVNHMYQMKNHPKALAMTKKLASGRD